MVDITRAPTGSNGILPRYPCYQSKELQRLTSTSYRVAINHSQSFNCNIAHIETLFLADIDTIAVDSIEHLEVCLCWRLCRFRYAGPGENK